MLFLYDVENVYLKVINGQRLVIKKNKVEIKYGLKNLIQKCKNLQ